MKQVPSSPWPTGGGWTIAVTSFSVERLAGFLGFTPETGNDDLDYYAMGAFEDPEIGPLWLFQHLRAPGPGTEVMVDIGITREQGLAAAERQFGLDKEFMTWINPYESHDAIKPDDVIS